MKLYIEHYTEIHKWKTMAFVTREWILRENHKNIIDDLKFLIRKWINVILYHNINPNTWNNIFISENIESKIPLAQIERIPSDIDIYEYVLSLKKNIDKLIILERQCLIWEDWEKINTISTKKLFVEIEENDINWLWIWNVNFRKSLLNICKSVENWDIHRVHIIPWWRYHSIKHELFSLEWVWTLIWNNFGKPEILETNELDVPIIKGILESNKGNKYLKPRTSEYILENIFNFRIAYLDWIPVGCVEIKQENERTIELWWLAVVHSFLSLRIWISLIEYVENYAINNWFDIISLTNNEKLQSIYNKIWLKKDKTGIYKTRENKSPWVSLFYIEHSRLIENSKL